MKNKMILTEDLFKELALPYCKNKENKPKKYSNSYYEPFKKYLERHNFFDILNKQNFEKFF